LWPTLWVSRVHHLCRIGEDDYFLIHKLYPNVDFYSGIIYQAMGFPVEMFRFCSRSAAPPAGLPNGRKAS